MQYQAGALGKIIYSEGEYYHYSGTPLGGFNPKTGRIDAHGWRRGCPPQFYSTHSNAYYISVTGGGRLTEVSCMGEENKNLFLPTLCLVPHRWRGVYPCPGLGPTGSSYFLIRCVFLLRNTVSVSWVDVAGRHRIISRRWLRRWRTSNRAENSETVSIQFVSGSGDGAGSTAFVDR